MRLTFLGAAGTVTGSKAWLSLRNRDYLVDCGLFQGPPVLEQRNWQPLPFDLRHLDAVLLTHAHLDHSGYVPRLVHDGYRGPVFVSEPTADLLGLLWPDAAHLEVERATYANRKGYSKHQPAQPLYTVPDASRALRSLQAVPVARRVPIDDELIATFHRAGHILGSAIVECELQEDGAAVRVVFSGDLGRYDQPVMREPAPIRDADYLVLESTYGDREHGDEAVDEQLARVVNATVKRGGVLLIPAFAVGRTQELLYRLRRLEDEGGIPRLPVYIDSPMATDSTDIYCRHGDEHNLRVDLLMDHDQCPLRCRDTHFTRSVAASKRINRMTGSAIIISASGMCSGGRVVHHLKQRLPDARNTVLLVGFQAAGTRGRALRDGATRVRIHGRFVPVRAQVEVIDGLSAHADQDDLMRWLGGFQRAPRQTFIVHGEPRASAALASRITAELGWAVTIARANRSYPLRPA